jgi:hypothetical protein
MCKIVEATAAKPDIEDKPEGLTGPVVTALILTFAEIAS